MKFLRKNSTISHYFFNTSWLMVENIFRLIAGLFIGIYVARFLGPEKFGMFSYVIAFTALFSAIAKLGLDSIVVREIVNSKNNEVYIIGTAFWLKLFGAIVINLIIYCTVCSLNIDDLSKYYIVIISAGMLFQSFEVVDFYFQSKVLSRYVSICKLIQLFLSCILKLYGILINADLLYFVYVTMIDQLTLGISLFFSFRIKEKFDFLLKFDPNIAKSLLKESWPLIIASVSITLYMRIDQIMIKNYLGVESVGIFSSAVKLSETIYFIPAVICTSLFPALVKAKECGTKEFNRKTAMLFELMMLIALLITIPVTFLSPIIINITFGESYIVASKVLQIHIWASIFAFLGVAGGRWLIVEKLAIQSMYRTVAGAICNISLNIWLIPKMGIIGAAYSTLISQFIASIGINAFNKKTRRCFILQIKAIVFPIDEIFIKSRMLKKNHK